jgi:hypothetical protein
MGALSLWVALRPVYIAPLPRAADGLLLAACVMVLALLYLWPAAGDSGARAAGPLLRLAHALPCLLTGALIAMPVYLVLCAFDRGGTSHGLMLGLCAGLSANAVLQLHCPAVEPVHLVAGHLGVVAVLLGVSGGLARRRRRLLDGD